MFTTYLCRISALGKSCLGYGLDAATDVSIISPFSASPSRATNRTDPRAVYANTSTRTPVCEKYYLDLLKIKVYKQGSIV